MEIPVEKVSVKFECPECGHNEMVSVADLVDIGDPICPECTAGNDDISISWIMEMGMAHISEANSC